MTLSSAWRLRDRDGIGLYRLDAPGPLIAFLTRPAGEPASLERVARVFGLSGVLTLRQVHSGTVLPAEDLPGPDAVEGDALITGRPGLGIAVRVADCLPVYIRARDGRAVGIAHAGRRGTAARLAEKTVRTIERRFGPGPADLEYALGPCICPDCYEVGPEVAERFREYGAAAGEFLFPVPGTDRFRLDIRAANRLQLNALGLAELPGLKLCTRENPRTCFSFRRDGRTGHNLALIALGPENRQKR